MHTLRINHFRIRPGHFVHNFFSFAAFDSSSFSLILCHIQTYFSSAVLFLLLFFLSRWFVACEFLLLPKDRTMLVRYICAAQFHFSPGNGCANSVLRRPRFIVSQCKQTIFLFFKITIKSNERVEKQQQQILLMTIFTTNTSEDRNCLLHTLHFCVKNPTILEKKCNTKLYVCVFLFEIFKRNAHTKDRLKLL